MGAILKTKNYFLSISFFCLACSSTLVISQFFSASNTIAATPVARLDDWRFTPEKLQLELSLSGDTRPRHFSLREPDRIVIDLPNTKLGAVPTKQNFSGMIQSVRISQLNAEVTRIVLDVAPGTVLDSNQVQLQPFTWQGQNIWVLSPVSNLAYNNSTQNNSNNSTGNFYHQQDPLFPQLPVNNNTPNLNDSQTPLFPQLSHNNNIPIPYLNNQPPNIFNPSNPNNLPVPIAPQMQPQVVVPPLNGDNNSQSSFSVNSVLPPAIFDNQTGFINTPTPATQPSFPMPNLPQYQPNNPQMQVLPYGQPIPQF